MIDIKATGLCEGCTVADLETEWLERNGEKTWRIRCTHEEACERATKTAQTAPSEEDDRVLLKVKTLCEARPHCAGCTFSAIDAETKHTACGIGYPYGWRRFDGKTEGKG